MIKFMSELIPLCIETSGTATIPIRTLWLVFQYSAILLDQFDGVTFFNTPLVPLTQASTPNPPSTEQTSTPTPLKLCWEAIEPAIMCIERLHSSVRSDIKETTNFLQGLNQGTQIKKYILTGAYSIDLVASGILPKPTPKPEKSKDYEDPSVQELAEVYSRASDDCTTEALYRLYIYIYF